MLGYEKHVTQPTQLHGFLTKNRVIINTAPNASKLT